jgi:hypothetical protein
MFTVFDLYSLVLLSGAVVLYAYRVKVSNALVYPYLIVALTCLVANWLGEAGGGIFALSLLIAASFSLLGCLLYPGWRNMGGPTPEDANLKPVSENTSGAD